MLGKARILTVLSTLLTIMASFQTVAMSCPFAVKSRSAQSAQFRFEPRHRKMVQIVEPKLEVLAPEKGATDSRYVKGLKKVSRAVNKFSSSPQDLARILYPFAGADGPMAFHLFPNAREVVGIDNHPFFSEAPFAHEKLLVKPNRGTSFRHTVDIDDLPEVGSRILGFLKGTIPGFRLKRILAHESLERETDYSSRTAPHWHTIVEFDSGPGTPLRRYVHLHLAFDPSRIQVKSNTGWWLSEVMRMQPQAVIVKAAHYQYREDRFRKFILSVLRKNSGLLIEGAETGSGYSAWEFSSKFGSIEYEFPNSESIELHGRDTGLHFGYSDSIRMTKFN